LTRNKRISMASDLLSELNFHEDHEVGIQVSGNAEAWWRG